MTDKTTPVSCLDCGADYAAVPMDVVLSKAQWLLLNPDDGGVLCPSCLVARAAKLPGAINLTARITFAEDFR